MREIKFRAWDNKRKEWCKDIDNQLFVNPKVKGKYFYIHDHSYTGYEEMLISQHTGLKDKNGKEIFEGDILEIDGGGERTAICPVFFRDGCFVIRNIAPKGKYTELRYYVDMSFCRCEIIGNIYENPELLN